MIKNRRDGVVGVINRRMVSGQRLCCTLTPVCFSLQVQAGAMKFQVLMTI
ncbi:MAG: hypothetical protein ACOX7X_10850 [Methanosarcina flavescens]